MLLVLIVIFIEYNENYQDTRELISNLFTCGNIKENYTEINKRKHFLDNLTNSIEIRPNETLVKKDNKINVESKLFAYKGNNTVIEEKRLVIENNRNSYIPNGLRVLNLSKTYASKDLKALDNVFLFKS